MIINDVEHLLAIVYFLRKLYIQVLCPFFNSFFLLNCKSSLYILELIPYWTYGLQIFSSIQWHFFTELGKNKKP